MGPRHLLLLATLCLQDAQTTPIIVYGPNPLPPMPCPNIGVDIAGPDCDSDNAFKCNNACFQNVTSWEACASQCSGVDTRLGIDMGYIAWSWQSQAAGKFALQCCCKNDFELSKNFPFYSSSSIMGTARCLGTGRTY
eukprot:GFUD01060593.1.p1 GENE.GFUD01060593.1~~GFUD01060593.1.p1  ORF type:complete len:137 (+),score=11.68 GFUD01060593.1:17-427(+)